VSQRRLPALLALLGGVALLRGWWPVDDASADGVVAAVVPAAPRAGAGAPATAPAQRLLVASAQDLSAGTREIESEPARNAFAVRVPPAPLTPPAPPVPPAPRPFVGPLLPPPSAPPAPPPPPPLQVIGFWHDEQGPSVFVSGPRGVMQGRVGDLLLSEYRIEQIGAQQVLVTHVASNRKIPLAVPTGTLPPLTASR
jgi:hypothetical protein